jgi:hypothetical protein
MSSPFHCIMQHLIIVFFVLKERKSCKLTELEQQNLTTAQ